MLCYPWMFASCAQVVTPLVYDESFSVAQQIAAIFGGLRELGETAASTTDLENVANQLKEYIDQKTANLDADVADATEKWVNDNLDFIFTSTAKQVFFGLTDDGRFVAYVPRSWDDITFDTGATYADDDYGRLILRWDTTGTSPVDQSRSQEVLQNGIENR